MAGAHRAVQRIRACVAVLLLALLLSGLTVLASACAPEAETSTTSTSVASTTTLPEFEGGSVGVEGLAVYHDQDGASGLITAFTVSVDPSVSGRVAVGVLEGEVFGTGAQWRAASWMAALAATSLLNLDLADYRVTYEVEGRIDGPSAGGLLTVGTLAALLGDPVRPDVTMTGTINPDFTIGPVGGIPHKLEAAAEAGKKIVLIPLGQRMDVDQNAEQYVDVVELGRSLGMEVREVGDVQTAYEVFTGVALPQPRVVEQEPQLTDRAHQVVLDQAGSWADFAIQKLDEYAGLPDAAKSDYEEGRVELAGGYLDDADGYAAQGLAGAAYFAAMEAARQAALASTYTLVEQEIQELGENAAALDLAGAGVAESVDELMAELLAVEPQSVGEAVSLLEAWGYWTVASHLSLEADDLLGSLPDDEDPVEGRLGSIYTAVFDYTLALIARDAARDALALGDVLKGESLRGADRLTELAEAYRRAAEANLETIQVLVVPQLAGEWGVSEGEAYSTLSVRDVNFAEAQAAEAHQEYLLHELPEGASRDYAVLGAALIAYVGSSVSLAEHYSYGATYDDEGDVVDFAGEKALANGLDYARGRARTMIALAGKGRADPALPTMYYESGGLLREGYPPDKLDALYDYWTASLYARVMAVLSGHLEPLVPRR